MIRTGLKTKRLSERRLTVLKKVLALLLGFITMSSQIQASTQLVIGSQAPDFTLPDETGNEWQLSKHLGKFVVLYFYPSDDTPGCTKQACSLRNKFKLFSDLNIVVVGINYDTQKSHKKFKEKYLLPFSLLSDRKKYVAKLYDARVWGIFEWFWPFPKRKTIIIDPKGTVISIINNVDVATHTDIVLEHIAAKK